jgi:PGF-pre-PGF domain-containing protein
MVNTTANQSVFENISVNVSALTDGRAYNITCALINSTGQKANSSVSSVTIDNTPPSVTGFANTINKRNYSGNITMNVNVNDTTIVSSVFFNMTNISGTQVNFTRMVNFSAITYNATLDTTQYPEGRYYITIYANDSNLINGTNGSVVNLNNTERIQIIFDNSIPNVTDSNFSLPAGNNYNYSGTIKLNISPTDSISSIGFVVFNITNSSGSQNAIVSASPSNATGTSWTASFNTSSVPEGLYNITAYVNDSAGNVNNTARRLNILIDNTKPNVSFGCSPLTNIHDGDIITCSCSGTDALAGISSISYTLHPSTSSTGSRVTACTIYDTAGNMANASYTYYVSQSGSSSGGSGSSSGGGSSNTPSSNTTSPNITIITKNTSISEITPTTPANISGFSSGTVNSIQIEVSSTASNVKVTVEQYNSIPSAVLLAKNNTYKYLHVDTQNLTGKLSNATMKIQVEQSWVTSENIDKTDVALFKYNDTNNSWNALATTYDSNDSTYYYYTAKLNSFSYFAIASNKVEEILSKEQPIVTYWKWIIIGTVSLAIIIIFTVFLRKKMKGFQDKQKRL